jgi:hypothetical protein
VGLTFLAPLLLVASAAVAIPVLLHLTHRERSQAVPFPSLMFLRRVPYRTVRRQRIRHWLLLLVRAAIVLLIVAAFARPFVERAGLGAAVVGEGRAVVILLDRSASMGYEDRWTRALAEARATVNALGPEDQAAIVLFSDRADATTPLTGDRAALAAVLDDTNPLATGTRYGPALQLARDMLDASDLPNRELVLLTDFQRIGWEADAQLRMPDGTTVRVLDLDDDRPENIAVTGVLLNQDEQGRLAVAARITRPAGEGPAEVAATLILGGSAVETRRVRLEPAGATTVDFAPVPMPERSIRGEVRVEASGLAADDAYRFTVAPRERVPLLLLYHPSGRPDERLYLRQALAIGDDPPFQLDLEPVTTVTPDDLRGRAGVILYDAPFPGGQRGRALRDFVDAGGGLLVILGARTGDGAWAAEAEGMLGEAPGPTVDRAGARGGALSILDYRHPAFVTLGSSRGADFSGTRFLRYRRWSPPESARVLARFDDGTPALAEISVGAGRTIVWTAGAANIWSDLPLQPVFLPFVQELVRYLVEYRAAPAARAAGTVLDLRADLAARTWGPPSPAFGPASDHLVVEAPSGERFALDDDTGYRVELLEHGYYQIRTADGDQTATVAVNTDPAESNIEALDPAVMVSAISPTGAGTTRTAALAAQLSPADKERRQALWWYLMVTVAALALAESLLAGRLSGGIVATQRNTGS